MNKKFLIIKNIIRLIAIAMFVILTLYTNTYKIAGWGVSLLLVKLIIDCYGAIFATLDYEESWKHPKTSVTFEGTTHEELEKSE